MPAPPYRPSDGRPASGAMPAVTVLLVALAYAAAIAAITFRTELAANSDGASALAAARSLASGLGFLSFDGSPQPYWPPLYPAFVGAFLAVGMELRWAAWLVNAITAFWFMWAVLQWLRSAVASRWLIALGVLGCAVLHPVLELFSEVRSDALLLAISLHSMALAARWLDGDERAFAGGVLLAALATLAKYQGVAVLGAWGLFVLLRCRQAERGACARRLALVGAAALPLSLWLLRNLIATGTLAGARITYLSPMEYLLDAGPRTLEKVTNWFVPESVPLSLRSLAFAGLVGVVMAGLVTAAVTQPAFARRNRAVLALAVFALLYLALTLLASVTSTAWGLHRYMSVLAPVLVMFVVTVLDAFVPRLGAAPAAAISLATAAVLLAVPTVRTADLVGRIQQGRAGYQYGDWYTELRPVVRQFDFRGPVLTNARGFVWLTSGQPERFVTRFVIAEWRRVSDEFARRQIEQLLRAPTPYGPARGDDLYFVEAFRCDDEDPTAKDLDGVFRLVPMVKTADGAIWRLE